MKKFLRYTLHVTGYALLPLAARAQFGLQETAEQAGLKPKGSDVSLGPAGFIGTVVGYILAFVGVIFFILMVYGGFLWMTARGNEEQVKKAKELIEAAIIGMVIIFVSYVVTRFVLTRLTGAIQ